MPSLFNYAVDFDLIRVLQNEGDSTVNLGERSDGWVCLEDAFRRPSTSEIVHQYVQGDASAGDLVAAVAKFRPGRLRA